MKKLWADFEVSFIYDTDKKVGKEGSRIVTAIDEKSASDNLINILLEQNKSPLSFTKYMNISVNSVKKVRTYKDDSVKRVYSSYTLEKYLIKYNYETNRRNVKSQVVMVLQENEEEAVKSFLNWVKCFNAEKPYRSLNNVTITDTSSLGTVSVDEAVKGVVSDYKIISGNNVVYDYFIRFNYATKRGNKKEQIRHSFHKSKEFAECDLLKWTKENKTMFNVSILNVVQGQSYTI